MTTRSLVVADRAIVRTLFNNNRAGIAAAWPGGAQTFTLAEMAPVFELPGAVNIGSFNGSTLRGIIASRPVNDSRLLPGQTAEAIWLWLTDSGLSLTDFRAAFAELMLAWWTNLQGRDVTFGIGRNPMVYPARMETLFQKMIQAGMPVEIEEQWRIVRMRPAHAIPALTRLAAIA